ncbi:MAG: VOC family protein [Chloroflexota bacterium]|nr:VOC family protein [Chloroflexota bacterium]
MAYRFLLEVPEALAADASVTVEEAGDAQVILVRDSHGLGFDERYVNLTVAAHSLLVIDRAYDWFDTIGASRPDIRIVLHSGERLALEEHDRGAMVAAIRRDQPWVERSIPKVGEHEVDAVFLPDDEETALADANRVAVQERDGERAEIVVPEMGRRVEFRRLNHVSVQVNDLRQAERFYSEFLNMELLARGRGSEQGRLEVLDGGYDWEMAIRTGVEADVSLMRNGPVTLALQRAGRGARLDRGLMDRLSVMVDVTTFANLKGEALMRSLTVLASSATSFAFLDPFGVAWELTVPGTAAAAVF